MNVLQRRLRQGSLVVRFIKAKRLSHVLLWICITLLGLEASPAVQQDKKLLFMFNLFTLLQESSAEQRQLDRSFEMELDVMLKKAVSLQHQLHAAEQGGLKKQNERLVLEKRGQELAEDVLRGTEDYLEALLDNLRRNRSELSARLLKSRGR